MSNNAPSQDLSGSPSEKGSAWVGKGIAAAVILSGLLMALQPIRSPDVWHHVKSGWLVRENGGAARADVFSCTAEGKRWIQYEWLAQFLIYGAHALGGVPGLLVFRVAGVMVTAAFLLMACRARHAGWPASGAAVALALCAASSRFFSRPEIFTLVILAALMATFTRLREGQHRLVVLPALLMIPWANMHGAWVAGLAWMGLVCGGDTAPLLLHREPARGRRTLVLMWAAMGLAALATLANPYGWHIWEVPLKLSNTPVVRQVIAEWKVPGAAHWLDPRHIGAWIFLLVLLFGLKHVTLADGLVVLFFGALSLTARRHLALAMLITTPIVARQFSLLWDRGVVPASFKRRLAKPEARAAAAIVLCAALVVVALGGFGLPRAGVGLDERNYPIGAARFLEGQKLAGNLFNSYAFGNYLLFARYPQNHVFIDGRVDMYGTPVVDLYDQVRRASDGWRKTLEDYAVEICVIETSRTPDARLLAELHKAPDWALVYWDDISAVYVQRTAGRADFLDHVYVYAVPPDTPNPPMLRTQDGLARAERDFQHKLEQDPDCVLALWGRAECRRRRSAMDEAISDLRKAVSLAPRIPMLVLNLGACLLESGQLDEAETYLRRALRLAKYQEKETATLRWTALWNLSVIHEKRGDLRKAVSAMERALRFMPDNEAGAKRLRTLQDKFSDSGNGR